MEISNERFSARELKVASKDEGIAAKVTQFDSLEERGRIEENGCP